MTPLPHPRESEFKPAAGRELAGAAILGLGGLLAAYLGLSSLLGGRLVALFPADGLGLAEVIALMLGGPVVLWLLVAAHELGHIAGGKWAGFRFRVLVAGPLRVEATEGDRLRLAWNYSFALLAGYAASTPTAGKDLRTGMIKMIAGGPAASLLVGSACLFLAFNLPAETGAATVARALMGLLGAGSLIVGFASLIPSQTGGFPTDGARLNLLVRNGHEAHSELALMTIADLSERDVGPRDWDPLLLQHALLAGHDSPRRGMALVRKCQQLLDDGAPDAARSCLSEALGLGSMVPHNAQSSLAFEAAYFSALVDGDFALATDWFSLAKSLPFPDSNLEERAREALTSGANNRVSITR